VLVCVSVVESRPPVCLFHFYQTASGRSFQPNVLTSLPVTIYSQRYNDESAASCGLWRGENQTRQAGGTAIWIILQLPAPRHTTDAFFFNKPYPISYIGLCILQFHISIEIKKIWNRRENLNGTKTVFLCHSLSICHDRFPPAAMALNDVSSNMNECKCMSPAYFLIPCGV
jgi:hypothetical protein